MLEDFGGEPGLGGVGGYVGSELGYTLRSGHVLFFTDSRLFIIASRPPQALSFDIPSLSTLSIVIRNGAHTTTPAAQRWHTLSWLHSTLSVVSYTSSIKKFTLRLTEQGVADLGREDDLRIWRGVDVVLAGRRFPELGMVRVVFDSEAAAQMEASEPADTEGFLERRVPKLVGKGVLEVVWGKLIYPREGKA